MKPLTVCDVLHTTLSGPHGRALSLLNLLSTLLLTIGVSGCGSKGAAPSAPTPGPVVPPPVATQAPPPSASPPAAATSMPLATPPGPAAQTSPSSETQATAPSQTPPQTPSGDSPSAPPPAQASGPATEPSPPEAEAAAPKLINPTTEGLEYFSLTGKPGDDQEKFTITGDVDSQEQLAAVPFPKGVDGTMFKIESEEGESTSPLPGAASARKFPEGVEVLPEYGYSPDGLPMRIRLTTNDPIDMALVPAGAFLRGTNDGPEDAAPRQSVYLDSFYMDLTEVTLDRYQKFRDAHSDLKRPLSAPVNQTSPPQTPAVGIPFPDAQLYSKWAGKELPSEAQWEKAARGTEGARFPWGDGRPLWARPRTTDQLDPAGSFPGDASPYGILDLAGNAREWCRDNYAASVYRDLGSSPDKLKNPLFTRKSAGETTYVVRGGADDWSTWSRGSEKGTARNPRIGFRCVYVLPSEK